MVVSVNSINFYLIKRMFPFKKHKYTIKEERWFEVPGDPGYKSFI